MNDLRNLVVIVGVAVGVCWPASGWSSSTIDGVEHLLGASNVHAVTGHGRLTAGVSVDGDLTVLTWPNPSYCDQLGYISSNASDARDLARFGAPESAGLFLGLRLDLGDDGIAVTWLRDAAWSIRQSYGPTDGPNIETVFESATFDLTVFQTDAVDPATDLLVRHVRIERGDASPVDAAWLLTYANLSPLPPNARLPQLPVVDWGLDGRDDFAALWLGEEAAILHFHPSDQRVVDDILDLLAPVATDFGPVGELLALAEVDPDSLAELADAVDDDYESGAYLALSTVPPPDQHQIGFDSTDFCGQIDTIIDNFQTASAELPGLDVPVDPALLNGLRCDRSALPTPERQGWEYQATDAWADVADGELTGADLAAGEVAAALRTPLTFEGDGGGTAQAAVLLGAGADAASALDTLSAGAEPAAVLAAAEAALSNWLAERRLPENPSERVEQVARRALINLRVGTASDSGAIVASITRQPPYGLDWPRDGAFFNVALDASGQSDLVTRRADLYVAWQRSEPAEPTLLLDLTPPPDPDTGSTATYPAGAWEMNYYADGVMAGTFRFEIDGTAFPLWTLVAHAGWLPETERADYLTDRWAAIEAAADLLARWRDPATGLQAPAQEDDNPDYTQTLHGAVTTFGALDIAARAARLLGHDETAERWEERAAELRDAILGELYDAEQRRFVTDASSTNPGSAPSGPTAWLVWPTRLLPWDDVRVQAQLAFDLDFIAPTVNLENEGGAYVMKNTVSAALALEADDPERARVQAMLEALAAQATEGTQHFGEVVLVEGDNAGPDADQRVATPHLWEGILFYLTALALEDPDALMAWDAALPPSRVRAATPAPWLEPEGDGDDLAGDAPAGDGGDDGPIDASGGGGCACRQARGPDLGDLPVLFALLALGVSRRRRRRLKLFNKLEIQNM